MSEEINIPALRFPEFTEAWERKMIRDVLTIGSGRDYKHLEKGNIPVYGTGGYMLSVDKYLYNGESVGIGRKGTINKPIFLSGKFWTVDTLFYTHSFKNILPKFIYLTFQNINWQEHNEASGVPSLSKSTIEKIKVNIPSLPEQTKIGNFLTAVDTRIQKLTRKKELLEKYKKGVIQKIFSQEIRFTDENGNDYSDWEEKTLGEVLCEPKQIPVKKPSSFELLTVKLHCKGIQCTGQFPRTTEKGRPYYQRFANELLIGRQNFHNGGIGIVENEHNGLIASNAISSYKAVSDNLKYIYYFISRTSYYKQVENIMGGTGQKEISKSEFNNLIISIPSITEQNLIVYFLTSIDKKIDLVKIQLDKLQKWKKGLLQQMFI